MKYIRWKMLQILRLPHVSMAIPLVHVEMSPSPSIAENGVGCSSWSRLRTSLVELMTTFTLVAKRAGRV
jgi:hypothetical protein